MCNGACNLKKEKEREKKNFGRGEQRMTPCDKTQLKNIYVRNAKHDKAGKSSCFHQISLFFRLARGHLFISAHSKQSISVIKTLKQDAFGITGQQDT